ncbi:MAG: sulfotransferase domain-containing protein [Acidobacteriales bacterium]|nr:sulfotransferase domain-containing protein [Terriglobales bacterium]
MPSTYRKIRHKASKTLLRGPIIWARHCGIDRNDVMVASYPRSGNTWLRFLLTRILTGKSAGFDSVNNVIAEIGIHHEALKLLPGDGRLIKTHELYRPTYKRAIYLVRDVRDVLLSQYSRENELGLVWWSDFDGYIDAFLQGTINGFGSWQEHIPQWLDSPLAKRGDMLMVMFADMRRDTQVTLERVVDFLGYKVEPAVIAEAIADNTVERMRERESKAVKLHKSNNEEGRFVRQGAIMGWRNKFTDEQLERIEQYAGKTMERMGFPSWKTVPRSTASAPELTGTSA